MFIVIAIIILICLSAFFSGSETGLTGSSRAKIHKLKIEGNKRAMLVSKLRDDKEGLIGAILLGNNAVNIAATVLASNLAIQLYGSQYNEFVLTILMTLVVLIFAEVLPKTYAFRNAEKVALMVAPVFNVLVFLFAPVTRAIQYIVNLVMSFFVNKNGGYEDVDDMDGADMLRGAIEMHHDEGAVIKDDRDMLGSILDLADTDVGEIMIHRKEIKMMDINLPNSEIVEYMLNSPYTRIPFWEDNQDNIIGTLHSKYLMRCLRDNGGDVESLDMREILQKPWFVPENRSLREQLQEFRQKHANFTFIVDEYGVLQGMITLEDIIEEIVGQIEEEPEMGATISHGIELCEDGSYLVDGQVSIRDFNRQLGWDMPDEDASTIAGLIIYEAQLIPEIKQVFKFHDCLFEIVKKDKNQVTKIRVKKV